MVADSRPCGGTATCRDPLPVTRYPLPVARCPLPVARCPLPVARCPLPVARCPLPVGLSSLRADEALHRVLSRLIGIVGIQVADDARRVARNDCVGRDIFADNTPASHNAAATKRHSRQDYRVEADPDVVFQEHWSRNASRGRMPQRVLRRGDERGAALLRAHP
jgi:hypothetical protein